MATTGTQVFEITMGLIDALVNGAYDNADTLDYKYRMVSIINDLMTELYQYSSNKIVTPGMRPMPAFIGSLTDAINLDDVLARGVLPHGCAAQLLVDDGSPMAGYHEQKYYEKLAVLKNIPQISEDIEDEYNILCNMSNVY